MQSPVWNRLQPGLFSYRVDAFVESCLGLAETRERRRSLARRKDEFRAPVGARSDQVDDRGQYRQGVVHFGLMALRRDREDAVSDFVPAQGRNFTQPRSSQHQNTADAPVSLGPKVFERLPDLPNFIVGQNPVAS